MFCEKRFATKCGTVKHAEKKHADKIDAIKAHMVETKKENVSMPLFPDEESEDTYRDTRMTPAEEKKLDEFARDLCQYMKNIEPQKISPPPSIDDSFGSSSSNLSIIAEEEEDSLEEMDKENITPSWTGIYY